LSKWTFISSNNY